MSKPLILKSKLLTFPHGFSTRVGGVSEGIYDSLNLGMNRGDDPEKVKENWRLFLDACGIDNKAFVCGAQVHSTIVYPATKDNLRPAYGEGTLIEADGYVTNEKNVPVAIFTADCVPILLEDSLNRVVGAVHAGWRGAVSDIEKSAISQMLNHKADVENIHIAIGPAIGFCCFEVGPEVVDGIKSLLGKDAAPFIKEKGSGKFMADLRGAVRMRFIQLGVKPENIELVGECTMCHPEKYWSHRYTGGIRGSQACAISIPYSSGRL